jgi:hypothetical protein
MNAATLPALIQLLHRPAVLQMEASRHTVAGYRDTFRLLLRFASTRHGKPPQITIEDIDADLVADSSFMARPRAGTPPAAATRGWPRSVRSSVTLR